MIRDKDIHLAVTGDELANIKAFAAAQGLTVSDAVRLTMREKVRKKLHQEQNGEMEP